MSGFNRMRSRRKNKRIQRPKTLQPPDEEDEDIFTVTYGYNFPFFQVHSFLIQSLYNKLGLKKLKRDYRDNVKRYKENKSGDREYTKKKILNLRNKIFDLKTGKTLDRYLEESNQLIQQLNETFNVLPDLFDAENNTHTSCFEIEEEEEQQITLIENFIKITSRYVKINFVKEQNQDMNHCSCGYNLLNVFVDEFGEQKCPNCDILRYSFSISSACSGGKNVKVGGNSRTYLAVNTFKRELTNFMGQQKVDIPTVVYELLDQWMQADGLPPASEIRKLPKDEFGKTEGTSLEQLINGLNAIGYPALYKHTNKIGKELLGWELHDLRRHPVEISDGEIEYVDLIPELCKDFVETQKEFYNVEKGERTSNICSQYRILQHLRLKNVHVSVSDFKLLSAQTLKNSERIWKRMVLRAGLKYKPLFSNEDEEIEEEGFVIVKEKGEVLYIGAEEDEESGEEESSISFGYTYQVNGCGDSYLVNLTDEIYECGKGEDYGLCCEDNHVYYDGD